MKKIIIKHLTLLFALVFMVFFTAEPAEAGFGVSPSNIYHEYLKPGGHFEQKITLSRSEADEELEIVVEPTLEELASWFTFDPGMRFTFPKGEHRISFTAIIDVPADAVFKTYGGVIRVKAISSGGPAGGVAIVKGARIDVELLTTELNVTQIEVKEMKMRDVVGEETLKLDINATNNGNTDVSPTAQITIMDLQMQELETLEAKDFGVLTPNKTEVLTAEFDTNLGTGEYFAEAAVLVNGTVARRDRLVFRIKDKVAEEIINKPKLLQAKVVMDFVSNNVVPVVIISLSASLLIATTVFKNKLVLLLAKKAKYLQIIRLILILATATSLLSILLKQRESNLNLNTETNPETKIEEVGEEKPEVSIEPTTATATEEGVVQGVFFENNEDNLDEPQSVLMVTANDGQVVYPLYTNPDITSKILYYAKSDETFDVIEEKSQWYRVVLPSGTSGWLPKESVKNSTLEER